MPAISRARVVDAFAVVPPSAHMHPPPIRLGRAPWLAGIILGALVVLHAFILERKDALRTFGGPAASSIFRC